MTHARAKIWARLIYKGQRTLDDVPEADREDVKSAYKELFGEDI